MVTVSDDAVRRKNERSAPVRKEINSKWVKIRVILLPAGYTITCVIASNLTLK
jgi:hypothetical protein